MNNLKTQEEFDEMTQKSEYILFKKSPTCMRSISAYKELEKAIVELWLKDIYILDVLDTWELKYYIADYYDIVHESPQVIVKLWSKIEFANHGKITLGRFHQTINWRHDTRSK